MNEDDLNMGFVLCELLSRGITGIGLVEKGNVLRTDLASCRSLTQWHHPHLLIIPVYATDWLTFSMSSVKPDSLFILDPVSFQILFPSQSSRDIHIKSILVSLYPISMIICIYNQKLSCADHSKCSLYDFKQCGCIRAMYSCSQLQMMGRCTWLCSLSYRHPWGSFETPIRSIHHVITRARI